jgi:acetyl-CoA acetyltransferase
MLLLISAENIAKKYEISREDQDKFAAESQQRVERAQKAGYFDKEIIPITVNDKKGSVVVDKDEPPRHGTTVEVLRKLKTAFQKVNIIITIISYSDSTLFLYSCFICYYLMNGHFLPFYSFSLTFG